MAMPETKLPEVLDTEEVYHGKVIDVSVYTVREDEAIYKREVVHHPGGAGVVAAFDDGTVALVRQYRHPTRRYVLELPAGRLSPPERPDECAARELEEEIGFRPGHLEKLTEFYTTPGFCEEKLWVYLATDLTETSQNLEGDEFVEIVRVPMSRALEMIAEGEIEDSKTIIGLLLAAPLLAKSDHSAEE
ncbi:MAG: ADP-ribose pyrophosphatase [Acidobacteriota bacterium]|nr:ADP-ribose pyrophosphatase [Acidobacteriota bacterium]